MNQLCNIQSISLMCWSGGAPRRLERPLQSQLPLGENCFPSRIWCRSRLLRLNFWDGLEPFDLKEEMSIFWSLMHICQLTPTKHGTDKIEIGLGLGYTMYCHRLPTDVFPFSAWMPMVELGMVKARPASVQLSQQLKTTTAASYRNFFLHTRWQRSTLFQVKTHPTDSLAPEVELIIYVCLPQSCRVERCKSSFKHKLAYDASNSSFRQG